MSMMAPKIIGEGSIAKRERKTVWRRTERVLGRWTLQEGTWKAKDRALSLISTHRRATSTFPTLGMEREGKVGGGSGGGRNWEEELNVLLIKLRGMCVRKRWRTGRRGN